MRKPAEMRLFEKRSRVKLTIRLAKNRNMNTYMRNGGKEISTQ
jgi:hypothetical protein